MKGFPSNHLFLNSPVKAVTNNNDGKVRIELENGKSEAYDHVILATPGDEAYSIIQPSATAQEHKILSQFRTSPTTAVLHSDTSLMPPSRETWSSCNYFTPSQGRGEASLTYNINTLQRIPRHPFGDILLTLNPVHEPDCETVQGSYTYSQPIYNAAAQQLLPIIQNTRGISYAGAWTGGGSHEDGFSSGLRVAHEHLGARLPFPLRDSSYSRGRKPELGLRDYALRLILLIVQVCLVEFVGRVLLGFRGRVRREVPRVNGFHWPEKIKKVF
jgi:predicted NAD/FAD-binding protein